MLSPLFVLVYGLCISLTTSHILYLLRHLNFYELFRNGFAHPPEHWSGLVYIWHMYIRPWSSLGVPWKQGSSVHIAWSLIQLYTPEALHTMDGRSIQLTATSWMHKLIAWFHPTGYRLQSREIDVAVWTARSLAGSHVMRYSMYPKCRSLWQKLGSREPQLESNYVESCIFRRPFLWTWHLCLDSMGDSSIDCVLRPTFQLVYSASSGTLKPSFVYNIFWQECLAGWG